MELCNGTRYHTLDCSHVVRTETIEPCGANCMQPGTAAKFICNICVHLDENLLLLADHYPVTDQEAQEAIGKYISIALSKGERPTDALTLGERTPDVIQMAVLADLLEESRLEGEGEDEGSSDGGEMMDVEMREGDDGEK